MFKIKNEKLFSRFSDVKCGKTELGQKQFFEEQSLGIKPEYPDEYYESLVRGKWQFDYLTSEYMKMYLAREWWGFLTLWKDWEGKRWVLPYLCKWYPSITGRQLPSWLGKETPICVNGIPQC